MVHNANSIPTFIVIVTSLAASSSNAYSIGGPQPAPDSFVHHLVKWRNVAFNPTKDKYLETGNPLQQTWNHLTQKAKDDVKHWFLREGSKKGIPFEEYVAFHRSNQYTVNSNFNEIVDRDLTYKDYYTKTFHCYKEGNLSMNCAEEALAATHAVIPELCRKNYLGALKDRLVSAGCDEPAKILDIAGSIGMSTSKLMDAFPSADVSLLDLSPYFLATAKMNLEDPASPMYDPTASHRVTYHHAYAENMPFEESSYDLISISYLFHELPTPVSRAVIEECFRCLKPGGTLAIVDLNPDYLTGLPHTTRFLFEIGEPYAAEFVKADLKEILSSAGFSYVQREKNDAKNARLLATK